MPSLLTWFHTLRHLKPRQCRYLLLRPLAMACARRHRVRPEDIAAALGRGRVALISLDVNPCYDPERKQFQFLNRTQEFPQGIAWNFSAQGMLWAYQLHYFEWLYDDRLTREARLETMQAYAEAAPSRVGQDAYPASLRIISWIRFLLRYGIEEQGLLSKLYSDAVWLYCFPEYQLDGNHLFENALALVAAGVFFRDEKIFQGGASLLAACLREQVLSDGGHVEGSPMYHSLLLWRVLQVLELLRVIPFGAPSLETRLSETAARMLGWLDALSFSDGTWPLFHDATPGVAPGVKSLHQVAAALGIEPQKQVLKASGYRMLRAGDFELALNVAPIQPAHQPGHAHADISSFCLHYRGQPVVVDVGVSSYEPGAKRSEERGTGAHNTVAVGGRDSSEIWRSFRVGRRARILSLQEEGNQVELVYAPACAPHCVHRRRFLLSAEGLRVEDELSGKYPAQSSAGLHFHPRIRLQKTAAEKLQTDALEINCSGQPEITEFCAAQGFNQCETALQARVLFTNSLFIEIKIKRC